MEGFDLSTKLWLSVMHYPSLRLSKFGQIEKEIVRGPLSIHCKRYRVFNASQVCS